MDGVIRTAPKTAPQATSEQKAATPHTPHPAATKKPRQHTAKHTARRKPQQAKTLMRHAVQKPHASLKPAIKLQAPVEIAAKPASNLAAKKSAANVDPVKLQRARQVSRHQHVQRFPRTTPANAVRPTAHNAPATTPQSRHHPTHQTAAAHHRATPPHQHTAQHTDIFEAAMARATSHAQPTPKHLRQQRRKRRTARIVTVVATLLIVGGLVTWLQWPHVELRVASFQAGFQASMPNHQLEGYERGSIRHEHGQIVMSYHSGDSHYQITQQSSGWGSRTLLDSAVAGASTEEPRVINSKGRIVYLYDNNASWVDNGVRYDITGDAPLTAKDIQAIVDSM